MTELKNRIRTRRRYPTPPRMSDNETPAVALRVSAGDPPSGFPSFSLACVALNCKTHPRGDQLHDFRRPHTRRGIPAMARLTGFRGLLCTTIAVVWALGGRASLAEPLRLVTGAYFGPFEDIGDDKAPGSTIEVLRQVFATMGQDVTFEHFPLNRIWTMIARGERDGMTATLRTSEREQICSFPDEPVAQTRWVLFVRAADIGKLKFSSFDDLVGHDVAVLGALTASPELWEFLREHHNMVETSSGTEELRMLAAGRVDYAVAHLDTALRQITTMGLSGKIEPLLSRSVIEGGLYVCFTKGRVSPSFVDAFSRALKQFKQTEAFQAIHQKYLP
jgi:polar amino acid transport system substrate-binding protein